jgi:hypothetical protein
MQADNTLDPSIKCIQLPLTLNLNLKFDVKIDKTNSVTVSDWCSCTSRYKFYFRCLHLTVVIFDDDISCEIPTDNIFQGHFFFFIIV